MAALSAPPPPLLLTPLLLPAAPLWLALASLEALPQEECLLEPVLQEQQEQRVAPPLQPALALATRAAPACCSMQSSSRLLCVLPWLQRRMLAMEEAVHQQHQQHQQRLLQQLSSPGRPFSLPITTPCQRGRRWWPVRQLQGRQRCGSRRTCCSRLPLTAWPTGRRQCRLTGRCSRGQLQPMQEPCLSILQCCRREGRGHPQQQQAQAQAQPLCPPPVSCLLSASLSRCPRMARLELQELQEGQQQSLHLLLLSAVLPTSRGSCLTLTARTASC